MLKFQDGTKKCWKETGEMPITYIFSALSPSPADTYIDSITVVWETYYTDINICLKISFKNLIS